MHQRLKLKINRRLQLPDRFGLLDSSSGHWKAFETKIKALDLEGGSEDSIKVFFLARHGEGFRGSRSFTPHFRFLTR